MHALMSLLGGGSFQRDMAARREPSYLKRTCVLRTFKNKCVTTSSSLQKANIPKGHPVAFYFFILISFAFPVQAFIFCPSCPLLTLFSFLICLSPSPRPLLPTQLAPVLLLSLGSPLPSPR